MLTYGLGVLVAVLLVAVATGGYQLRRARQQLLDLQQAFQQLEQTQTTQLKSLSRRLDNYLSGSMQMGRELHELREQVAPLPDKLLQIEQRDPGGLSFIEAARLLGLGASSDDLQTACGLTQAEAELLQRMHAGKR